VATLLLYKKSYIIPSLICMDRALALNNTKMRVLKGTILSSSESLPEPPH